MANADGSVIIRVDIDDDKAAKKLDKVAQKAEDIQKSLNEGKSITFNMDVSDAEKEIARLRTSISKLEEESEVKRRLMALHDASNEPLAANLEAEKNKLASMQSGDSFYTEVAIEAQKEKVAELQKEWDEADKQAKKYEKELREINVRLDVQKNKIGEIANATSEAAKWQNYQPKHSAETQAALERMEKAAEELGEFAKKDETAIEKVKDKAAELGAQIGETSKNAGKIQAGLDAFAKRLKVLAKRALVFTVIAKALSALRDWLADVVAVNGEARDAIAQLKGALLTLAQPLVQIIIPAFTALVKVLATVVSFIASIVSGLFGTTAAESADAAKSLNDQKNAYKGVGSAAKSASKQLASFDEINKLSGDSGGGASAILPDFSKIGKLDFLDKITDRLKKIGQDIANIFKDITGFIGNVFSGNWGAALDNIGDFVTHARQLLADLLDFVSYIFGAIIDTIIEKCGLAGTPVGDMMTGIKDIVQGALGLISGILTLDLEKMKQSVIQMFTGIKTFVLGVFEWFRQGLTSLLNWLDENTNGRFHELIELAKTYVNDVVEGMKQIFSGLIEFLTGVFTLDWTKAWEGIKEIFRGIWNTIVGIFEAAVNLIIKGINWLIDQLNKIHFEIPDWVPGIGGKSFGINISHVQDLHIPRLAQGAVIPPNREFMAVLGDQKSGTNIETPLATMVQAFKQALAESGYNGGSEAVLVLDKEVLGKVVYRLNKAEGTRIGVNLSEVQG